ncbi:hypothetical protein B0H13DRAFT_1894342 [Mycena leptocephala]|nr:hypothetical protein B0H13DRAFT_1902272 [Mycena leptocephala]KAJ7875014.1 hypothetical protein B0H13DRAFT_1894342 [Mycena leptocephala]
MLCTCKRAACHEARLLKEAAKDVANASNPDTNEGALKSIGCKISSRNPKHGQSSSSLQARRNKYLKPGGAYDNGQSLSFARHDSSSRSPSRLLRDFQLDIAPTIELGFLAKLARPEVFHPCAQYAYLASLADITLQVLGRRLDKRQQNSESDWSAEHLSNQQLLFREHASIYDATLPIKACNWRMIIHGVDATQVLVLLVRFLMVHPNLPTNLEYKSSIEITYNSIAIHFE